MTTTQPIQFAAPTSLARKGNMNLARALEDVLAADPTIAAASKVVAERQRALRAMIGDEAWDAYLELEHAVNAREGEALRLTARWANERSRNERG